MGHSKKSDIIDPNKLYEENVVGMKGIMIFASGLVFLIVLTFILMWAMLKIFDDQFKAEKETVRPIVAGRTEMDRLPPEPRLQAAPGFWVEGPDGRVNLELKEPQAEYRALKKIWDNEIKMGQKDKATGSVVTLPVSEAKERFLNQNVKARTGEDAGKKAAESRMFYSDASSGQMASEKRR